MILHKTTKKIFDKVARINIILTIAFNKNETEYIEINFKHIVISIQGFPNKFNIEISLEYEFIHIDVM